jgi:hypothetical protein
MRKAISLAFALMFLATVCVWAQSSSAPKILMISRQTLKEGRITQYQGLDRQVRQLIHKSDPNLNWITATAYTGADNEEAYFQFFNSYAEVEQVNDAFGKAAGTLFASADFNQTVADTEQSGRNVIAMFRENLSLNPEKLDVAHAKYWQVSFARVKPGSGAQFALLRQDINTRLKTAGFDDHYLVYEVQYGIPGTTYITIRDLKSLADLDTSRGKAYEEAVPQNLRDESTAWVKENALGTERVIYQVRPELSHPAQTLVAANPDFWSIKEQEQAPVVANKKTKKQAVQPASQKEKANQ